MNRMLIKLQTTFKRHSQGFGAIAAILVTFFFSIPVTTYAQRPFFQLANTRLHTINPAFSGLAYSPKVSIGSRSQWAKNPASYLSGEVSYDQFFRQIKGGVSAQIQYDRAGDFFTNTAFSAAYAYQLQLGEKLAFRLGMGVGIINQSVEGFLLFGDQLDPEFGSVNSSGAGNQTTDPLRSGGKLNALNAQVGFAAFGQRWYAGASVQHLNTPEFSLQSAGYQLPMLINVQFGYGFTVYSPDTYTDVQLVPSFIYQQLDSQRLLQIGALLKNELWHFGICINSNLSNQAGFVSIAGLSFSKFTITYSFDAPLNGIGVQSTGSHEIGIIIQGDKKPFLRSVKYKDVYCPSFLRY